MSRGAREANNELEAELFGSDEPVLSTTLSPVTGFCLVVMSTSEMRVLKPEKRFL